MAIDFTFVRMHSGLYDLMAHPEQRMGGIWPGKWYRKCCLTLTSQRCQQYRNSNSSWVTLLNY